MRAPKWFKEELAAHGALVLERTVTDDDATVKLKNQILAKDKPFAELIVRDYVRKQLRAWTRDHVSSLYAEADAGDTAGQLDLFPELPRRIEVGIGRFADIAVMTAPDWDAAVRQADTKAGNASGYAAALRRVYDQVRPLLTDDELTTAEVWKPSGESAGAA